jgi:signal peptidase II
MSRSLRLGLFLALCATAFAADQVSKQIALEAFANPTRVVEVLSFFNLRLGFNSGISFGLFATDSPYILITLTAVVIAILAWWAFRAQSVSEASALGFIVGGALGNLVDRIRHGAVVDFLDVFYNDWHWPTFNVADIAIVTGTLVLVLTSLRQGKMPKPA